MMMSIVEEKRIHFASVLRKACNDARNATVMVVPTFRHFSDTVGYLSELSVTDNQDNTFPYIESNSPSKMLSPSSSSPSSQNSVSIISNSSEINGMDLFYETECQELCTNNLPKKEIICKQDIILTEEDQEFLGIIGQLNVFENPKNSGDLSLYVSKEEKKSDDVVICCLPEKLPEQEFQDLSSYVGKSPDKVYFQTDSFHTPSPQARYQPYSTRCKEQSPEEILKKRERNRLRSKAYRLRKKLQFEALRQEVKVAKVAAEMARKEMVVAEEKPGVQYNQSEANQCTVIEYQS